MTASSNLNRVRTFSDTVGNGSPVHFTTAVSILYVTEAEAGAVDGKTYTYLIEEGNDWEIQSGVYTASTRMVTRQATARLSKIAGSVGTAKMSLGGNQTIRILHSAEDTTLYDAALSLSATQKAQVQANIAQATLSKSADYTAVAIDRGALFLLSGSHTLAFTAVATLGDGWWCVVKNTSTGTWVLDPNSSETIDDSTTISLLPGEGGIVWCDGSALHVVKPYGLVPFSRAAVLSDVQANQARANTIAASVDAGQDLGLCVNPFREISQENGTTLMSAIGANRIYAADGAFAIEGSAGALVLSAQQILTPFSGTADLKRLRASTKVIATTLQSSYSAGDIASPHSAKLEGCDTGPLGWGTGDARSIVIIGIVQVSVTGDYPLSVVNGASNRSYVRKVSLVANTPTVIFEVIPGDTSGTWASDNTVGMVVALGVIAGSTYQVTSLNTWSAGEFYTHSSMTNWGGTTNAFVQVAYFNVFPVGVLPWTASSQITGEALHRLLGTRRPYPQEFMLCQRYFQKSYEYADAPGTNYGTSDTAKLVNQMWGGSNSGGVAGIVHRLMPRMRVAPTLTYYDVAGTSNKVSTMNFGAGLTNNVTPNGVFVAEDKILIRMYQEGIYGVSYGYKADARP